MWGNGGADKEYGNFSTQGSLYGNKLLQETPSVQYGHIDVQKYEVRKDPFTLDCLRQKIYGILPISKDFNFFHQFGFFNGPFGQKCEYFVVVNQKKILYWKHIAVF